MYLISVAPYGALASGCYRYPGLPHRARLVRALRRWFCGGYRALALTEGTHGLVKGPKTSRKMVGPRRSAASQILTRKKAKVSAELRCQDGLFRAWRWERNALRY